ncbi:hypothetical protein VTJ04DRAFT_1657 [Mycothermus thermophilus]|uniref:uncharacterized protein n=1 Tax=Humicola insolens TaxID=85995 RepID=UPI003742B38C
MSSVPDVPSLTSRPQTVISSLFLPCTIRAAYYSLRSPPSYLLYASFLSFTAYLASFSLPDTNRTILNQHNRHARRPTPPICGLPALTNSLSRTTPPIVLPAAQHRAPPHLRYSTQHSDVFKYTR